jgi:ParB/RepB/Spo0J family partition protein
MYFPEALTRFQDESIAGLAESIRARGLGQPIIVESNEDGWYELVAGERRLRATKLLGRTTIEGIVRGRSNHNGRERFIDAIIENEQREDMTPIEIAQAFRFLQVEHSMTVREISKELGKNEAYINNHLLLTKLDQEIQDMVEDGFWKDSRLVRGLLEIDDRETRIKFVEHLWTNKVSLKGCLIALGKLNKMTGARQMKERIKTGTPAMVLAGRRAEAPTHWNMLKQLGKVPAWETVVKSAESTCQNCPLRSIASKATCSDCGAVAMLRSMMEAGNAR